MAAAPRVGDVVELRIDALAAGGDGVGRTAEGRVVFVPRTAPGDRVKARIAALHPRYARAELEQIVEPSPARVAPRVCGVRRVRRLQLAARRLCGAVRGEAPDRRGRAAPRRQADAARARRAAAVADPLRLSRARARGGGGGARRLSAREQPRALRGEPLPDSLRARGSAALRARAKQSPRAMANGRSRRAPAPRARTRSAARGPRSSSTSPGTSCASRRACSSRPIPRCTRRSSSRWRAPRAAARSRWSSTRAADSSRSRSRARSSA